LVKHKYDILDIARFYSKVDVGKRDDCWLINGTVPTVDGYGTFSINGKSIRAHRFSYEVFHGPIPSSLVVRHRCDTPLCVNPYHLQTGTVADNVMDRMLRGRSAKGETNGQSKITAAIAKKIFLDQRPYSQISATYGLHKSSISQIKLGKTWSHVTGKKFLPK
jgi:hypothetical protein